MQNNRSPGHVILVVRGEEMLRSKAHDHTSAVTDLLLLQAFRNGTSRLRQQDEVLVLGGHEENGTAVVIAELGTNIRRVARIEVLWQLGVLAMLAMIAAIIVDAVLWRLIRGPLRRMVTTVDAVAGGDFGIILGTPVGRELQALTRSFNLMSVSLESNERRRHQEMSRARKIQEHLLPKGIRVPGLSICRDFQPAEEVGGDYYDLIPLSNGSWMLIVADVAGHGIPAAMAATILKALLLCVSERTHDLSEILQQVNQRIISLLPTEMFVTVLIAIWYPGTQRLVYVNAGHPSGLVWNPRCGFRNLDATAMPVGILDAGVYHSRELKLDHDDRMVWFTDGLIEAFSPTGEMFGKARLQELIIRCGAMSPEKLRDAILTAVHAFVGDNAISDDLTLLVAGRN
ncbi:MAG: SpoIIE family protein phosphatase [Planctomycetaceae bacterium]